MQYSRPFQFQKIPIFVSCVFNHCRDYKRVVTNAWINKVTLCAELFVCFVAIKLYHPLIIKIKKKEGSHDIFGQKQKNKKKKTRDAISGPQCKVNDGSYYG